MCGIAGYYKPNSDRKLRDDDVHDILATLQRRGPDASGYYCDSHVFLGHTRLSIIDLSSGSQPMYNENGTKCIIFNGEIFNFQEIRKELIQLGHVFKTNSDTESILHAYEEWDVFLCHIRYSGKEYLYRSGSARDKTALLCSSW
jgi:asparagine synthase (glutamine-hydrolysing)